MPLGLFRGTRTYRSRPVGDATEFAMDEVYTGPLAGWSPARSPTCKPSFEEFAECLKATAESAAAVAR